MKHFGQTLRQLIDRSHLQDKEFCDRAQISPETLYRHLREAKPIGKKSTYRAIAQALDITPAQLDAAWMEEGAGAAPPATPTDQEKRMDPLDLIRGLSTLSFDQLDMLQAAIARRMEQVRPAQNSRAGKAARPASA